MTVGWVQYNYASIEEILPFLERQWGQEKFCPTAHVYKNAKTTKAHFC